VNIVFKKDKIQEFFYSLQELVEVNYQATTNIVEPEKHQAANPVSTGAHSRIERNSRDQRERSKSTKTRESSGVQEPALAPQVTFKEEINRPLQQRPFNYDNMRIPQESVEASFDDISLKRMMEPKKTQEDNSDMWPQRKPRISQQRPHQESPNGSPQKLELRPHNDKSGNKENRLDTSKMTSKEIFDLSQNSMNDLLHSDLGVTRLNASKRSAMSPKNTGAIEKDSFCLHFFQPRSNRLHLIYNNNGKWHKDIMELGEFSVPRYHKSLLTAEGVVILSGGFVGEQPSKRAYLLDIERILMTEISEMNLGRTGHIMVAHCGLIYAIGGVGEDGATTDTCEVFSPELNTWNEIARLNHACHSACAVSANGSIYKFGGKNDDGDVSQVVERFNGERWVELKVDLSMFRLYTNSLVFQVSQSELMIVGGTQEEYENKTSDTFIIKLPDNDRTTVLQCRPGPGLPVEEGFWSQEVELARGRYYMLQNVVHHRDMNSVLLDQRRVLEFDPAAEHWSVVSPQ
jgi:Kelch motif